MTRFLAAMRAVLIKDLRLLWPLALLNVGLFLGRDLMPASMELQKLAGTLSACAASLFIVAAIHEDAPASPRSDWLTRPVPPAALLAEKLVILFGTLLVPSLASQLLQGLMMGLPLADALRVAWLSHIAILPLALGLVAVAALTRSMIEAGVVGLAFAFLSVVVTPLSLALVGLPSDYSPAGLPTLFLYMSVAGLAGSALVLWLQYAPRRTGSAWAAFVGTLLLLMVIQVIFVLSLPAPQS